MTVLFLSQIVPYPPHGGVLQRGFHLLRELGRRADVHLLAFVHPDALPKADTLAESRRALGQFCSRLEYFELWPKRSRLHTAAALGLGLCSKQPFSVIAHRSRRFAQAVRRALTSRRFDVVHVDTVALTPFVDLSPGRPWPVALTHHNIESQLMHRRAEVETRPAARWFLRREAGKLRDYEAAAGPRYDVNIFMSAPDRDLLIGRLGDVPAAVVPNGVDVEYFTPAADSDGSTSLIYTGGMNMFANRDAVTWFAREVWPQIRAAVPAARFLAVGQDPPRELLDAAATDTGIVATGYVDDIRPLVGEAAVYVVPLRVGGGTRLKVLDAMACGKALVSTTLGCEGLDVVAGRHLLVADTPAAFAQSVVDLIRQPDRRAALGRAARALVEERYAWPAIGEQLIDAYRLAITHHARRR